MASVPKTDTPAPAPGETVVDRFRRLKATWIAQTGPLAKTVSLTDLRTTLNLKGKAIDGRRLAAIAWLKPTEGRRLCLAALQTGSRPVKVAALQTLAVIAPADATRSAINILEGKSSAALRLEAVRVLDRPRTLPRRALSVLVRVFQEFDTDYRLEWRLLTEDILKRAGRPVVQLLLPLLKDANPSVRQRTAWVLGDIGPSAAEAVPALVSALQEPFARTDPNPMRTNSAWYVPRDICSALGRIGPNARAAVSALTQALEDCAVEVRVSAAEALFKITGKAARSLPALIAALHSADWRICLDATIALGEIGPLAKEAVPELARVLRHRSGETWHIAAEALGRIGHKAKEVVPLLIPMVNEDEYIIRLCAIKALGMFGPRARAALPTLREAAKDHVGMFGPRARAALPALRKAAEDHDRLIQELIGPAIAAIEGRPQS